jgi:hypothetical protein
MVIVIQLPQNIIGYISNESFLAVVIHLLLRNAYKKVGNFLPGEKNTATYGCQ